MAFDLFQGKNQLIMQGSRIAVPTFSVLKVHVSIMFLGRDLQAKNTLIELDSVLRHVLQLMARSY